MRTLSSKLAQSCSLGKFEINFPAWISSFVGSEKLDSQKVECTWAFSEDSFQLMQKSHGFAET